MNPTNLQTAAFCGLIIAAFLFINSILHDPYFRGVDVQNGRMEIKGFGRQFRESLRQEEIAILGAGELPPGVGKSE